jgi:3-oxoacyl-[acyl-carrier-protein] synthase III
VQAVLASNFARNVMNAYLSDVGYGGELLDSSNVGRVGHCLGSDPLVNLADRLAAAPAPAAGDDGHLVLLGAGIAHLAALLLGGRALPADPEGPC